MDGSVSNWRAFLGTEPNLEKQKELHSLFFFFNDKASEPRLASVFICFFIGRFKAHEEALIERWREV